MDNQRNPLLTFAYYCQGKSVEDLRHSLCYTTLELEQTRVAVQEELERRDDQLLHLKDLLGKVIRERDAAQEKCQRLLYEKLLLQQQQHQQKVQQQQLQAAAAPLSGISSCEDEHRRGTDSNNGFSSSDCEESIVSSPVIDPIPRLQHPQPQLQAPNSKGEATVELLQPEKPLPEKGRLLQAVMKAGPLLQTLLLAGPLPQWRHPPPPLESFEIPPVTIPSPPPPLPPPQQQPQLLPQQQPQLLPQQDSLINIPGYSMPNNCGKVNRKRVLCDASDSPTETKYQRLILH